MLARGTAVPSMSTPNHELTQGLGASSRRDFLKSTTAAVFGGSLGAKLSTARGRARRGDPIHIGLVGCGGRGTGAVADALRADENVRLVAVADAFGDRLESALEALREPFGERAAVAPERRFIGFGGYEQLLASDVDVVLLATPPHFRPMHLRAAIEAGKHVFAEKPAAVDAPGVRSVLETTELARAKGLCIVSGLHMRYSPNVRELMARVHDGAIGRVVAMDAVMYGDGVWMRPRESGMTEMQYQMRNWYYFTWLSGDFNVEQFIHQYDQFAWALQGRYPVRCYGTGGRQSRTGRNHGHIYDHFSSVFEFEGGARAFATARHQVGCSSEVRVVISGTHGTATLTSPRRMRITGRKAWQPPRSVETDGHQLEHDAFFASLRAGRVINDGERMAKTTLMAIMARMCAYTGKSLTWDEALESRERLAPAEYGWDAEPPAAVVAIPGVTKFI